MEDKRKVYERETSGVDITCGSEADSGSMPSPDKAQPRRAVSDGLTRLVSFIALGLGAGVFGLILLVSIFCFGFLADTTPLFIMLFVLLGIALVFYCGLVLYAGLPLLYDRLYPEKRAARERAEEEKAKILEAGRRTQKDRELGLQLLNRCLETRVIESEDEVPDAAALRIVAKDLGVDPEQARRLFNLGKEEHKKVEKRRAREQKEKLLLESREREEADFSEQSRLAGITGREKYLAIIDKEIANLEQEAEQLASFISSPPLSSTMVMDTKSTSGIGLAAVTGAVLGPSAGMATALDHHRKEERAHRSAESARESVDKMDHQLRTKAVSRQREVQEELPRLKRKQRKIQLRLVDDGDIEAKFLKIKAKILRKRITECGNVELKMMTSVTEPVDLLGRQAVLDGSLEVLAKLDDKVVGNGFYVAPGYGETNLSRVGFGQKRSVQVLLRCQEALSSDCLSSVRFVVRPLNIWSIER